MEKSDSGQISEYSRDKELVVTTSHSSFSFVMLCIIDTILSKASLSP